MSIAFIFRTDVHVADRNPASWKGDYPAEILDSLRQVGDLAKRHNAQAVLDGGDFFHVKASVRTSHATIIKVVALHKNYPCPTYCVEGNHDITGDNLSTIEQQPLGVLYETGTFHHLREEVFEQEGLRVRVVGVPYDPTRTVQEFQRTVRKKPGDDYLIAIVHALAAENPPAHVEEFFGEPVYRYDSLVYDQGPDVFCFGHWHRDQGIVQIKDRHFVNQGALSRGALTRENTQRVPKVSVIEFSKSGITTQAIPLTVAPASEVFDIERKERQEREEAIIDQFSDSIEVEAQIDPAQDIEAVLDSVKTYKADIRALAKEYLEKARS